MFGTEIERFPDCLNVQNFLDGRKITLFNPFNSIMPYREIPMEQISYRILQEGRVIADMAEIQHIVHTQNPVEKKLQMMIDGMLENFFPEAVRIYKERAYSDAPKNKKEPKIDDIMLVQQKPKQKIGSPTRAPKPTLRAR